MPSPHSPVFLSQTRSILTGTYDLSSIDLYSEVKDFLSSIQKPSQLQWVGPISTIVSATWRLASKSSLIKQPQVPLGVRPLTHYKVCTTDESCLSLLLSSMISIPSFRVGFSPSRWHWSIEGMLKKQPGQTLIHRLRVIQLLKGDMDLAFCPLWGRRLVNRALHHNVASPWQFGDCQ